MQKLLFPIYLFIVVSATAQNKKPLDHSVYDGWKSVGEKLISNDGQFIVYNINPQEGDGELTLQSVDTTYKKLIPRGYNAVLSQDSKYAFCKIKPLFQETRQAKIKKKKPEEMPKDSLAIVEFGKDSIIKIARVKNFKTPEKGSGWLAWQLEKPLADSAKKKPVDSSRLNKDQLLKLADSVIRKSLDSIKGKIKNEKVIEAAQKAAKAIIKNATDEVSIDAETDDANTPTSGEGSDLVLRKMGNGKEKIFRFVTEYYFDKKGTRLLIEISKNPKDSNSKALLLLYNLAKETSDTILRNFNDCKNFAFDEEGAQLAFVAERDSAAKSLQKFYKLWYYTGGKDSATMLTDKNTKGVKAGYGISEYATLNFSKDGKKLYFGTALIRPPKDTTLVDFELARLDIWNYKDDYLQPQQLKQLDAELKRSYTAVVKPGDSSIIQLGDEDAENIIQVDEGNAEYVLATSTKNHRIENQWVGRMKQDAYIISTTDGKRKLVAQNIETQAQPSPGGKYIYWYDLKAKNYFTYQVSTGKVINISSKIKAPLYDIEADVPDYPPAAGVTGWMENDRYFLINDFYDIWKVDPNGIEQPGNITGAFGKKNNTSFEYVKLDPEKRFFKEGDTLLLKTFNKKNKYSGFVNMIPGKHFTDDSVISGPYTFGVPVKAKNVTRYLVQRANTAASELYVTSDLQQLTALTNIASQQKDYNWYTAEKITWQMFDGKTSEGILYKPENFDPKKKYPIIFYYYERNADALYNYRSPWPALLPLTFRISAAMATLVFDPNIYYKTGEPGQSAYNSIVSAAKYLSKNPWVDSNRMGLQGQSWGGYQTAYIVTRTNIFKAAEAGAPVANMTSAYGGLRAETGLSRQFQYEKSQSRLGASLWENPELYIKNSPLFKADKITTPLLIMHNDADGIVPWSQGVELFTALKRLGKKVWLLQYNGENHNLQERKNRKDLSVRLAQFFDYLLKGAEPAEWIKNGLPATEKGRSWGLKQDKD